MKVDVIGTHGQREIFHSSLCNETGPKEVRRVFLYKKPFGIVPTDQR